MGTEFFVDHFNEETLSVHQLRRTVIASSRCQGVDAQFASGSDNVSVPEKRQKGKTNQRI